MGVWTRECVRIDGEVMAAVKMQDDWTGNITLHVRKIFLNGNTYYCNVQKQKINVTDAREQLLRWEDENKRAREWYNKTKF